ncbi:MAG TPA: PHB depolymerase family esterase [Labilithrix sp.]|nr:PHB depolymerase family esterase [Labilithrix sp.]
MDESSGDGTVVSKRRGAQLGSAAWSLLAHPLVRFVGLLVFALTAVACAEEAAPRGARHERRSEASKAKPYTSGLPGAPSDPGAEHDSGTGGTTPPETSAGKTDETMEFGGKTRSYILVVPEGYDASKSYPLVLSFHGNPSSATFQASHLPFESVSKEAAVVVYPQASTSDWDLYTATDGNADMSWIRALPEEIATKKASIDRKRVFGFGYSGGGFFLSQFACRFGDVFKAISINAGGGPDEDEMGYGTLANGCYQCPGGPVATIVTHGSLDVVVTPSSGERAKSCFAAYNGCKSSVSASAPSPCEEYDDCATGKPVKWCRIPGQSHLPWNKAMTTAWDFFSALP